MREAATSIRHGRVHGQWDRYVPALLGTLPVLLGYLAGIYLLQFDVPTKLLKFLVGGLAGIITAATVVFLAFCACAWVQDRFAVLLFRLWQVGSQDGIRRPVPIPSSARWLAALTLLAAVIYLLPGDSKSLVIFLAPWAAFVACREKTQASPVLASVSTHSDDLYGFFVMEGLLGVILAVAWRHGNPTLIAEHLGLFAGGSVGYPGISLGIAVGWFWLIRLIALAGHDAVCMLRVQSLSKAQNRADSDTTGA